MQKILIHYQAVKLAPVNLDRFNRAVAHVLGCTTMAIVSVRDTPQKKIAVFILSHVYGLDSRRISQAYSINRLYIPTVVKDCLAAAENHTEMADIVHSVLNRMEGFIEAEDYGNEAKA